jgi:hypothetical protein
MVALLSLEAASLAAMSFLHLSGILDGGSEPFEPSDAGIAEALICLALSSGAFALVRRWPQALTIARAATGFAILGFVVGLNVTIRGGDAIDVAYHATVLPLLLVTFAALLKPGNGRSGMQHAAAHDPPTRVGETPTAAGGPGKGSRRRGKGSGPKSRSVRPMWDGGS